MKRLAIFAHFDRKNVVDDYVLFYVNQLKKHCEKIVFVSLSDLSEEEINKLPTENVLLVKHNEYDFGSYKRGFEYAKENSLLDDIDEVLFVNDSCFCIKPLDEIFEHEYNSDFWGIVKNNFSFRKIGKFCFSKHEPHLQSWFVAFRKNVFTSEIFENFLKNIKEEKTKNDVILNYEIGLTKTLKKGKFKYEAYVKGFEKSYNPSVYDWRELIENGFPFIKRSVLLGFNRDKTTIDGWEKLVSEESQAFIKKNTGNVRINTALPYEMKQKILKILATSPDIQRRLFVKILKTFKPFVFD